MAQINTSVTTYHTNAQTRLVRDVGDKMHLLYPNIGTLLTFLSHPQLQRKQPTRAAKFEWFEDDYTSRWGVVGTDTVTASTANVTITVTDGTAFVTGDLVAAPQARNSSTAPEVMRVTSVSSNTIITTRAINGTIMTLVPGAPLAILGPAYAENSSRPNPKVTTPVAKFGYTQIFRSSFSFSRTQMASATYAAPNGEFARTKLKRFQEHKRDINRSFLWGAATQSLGANEVLRTTASINSVLSSNVLDGGTTLTQAKWEEFVRMSFAYGDADTKLFVASPVLVSAITYWAKDKLRLQPSDSKWGLHITEIETGQGRLLMVKDQMLEDYSSSATAGFSGWGFVINPEDVMIRVLSGNGISGDTKYIEYDIQNQNGVDGVAGEYLTEVGLQVINEKHHAKIYNVAAYS